MATTPVSRGIQKKNSKKDVSNSILSTDSKTDIQTYNSQITSSTTSTTSTVSTGAVGSAQMSEASLSAQMEAEPVQRRVSKSRARFQIDSRFESRMEDSGDDPSLAELKSQLDEYRGMRF